MIDDLPPYERGYRRALIGWDYVNPCTITNEAFDAYKRGWEDGKRERDLLTEEK